MINASWTNPGEQMLLGFMLSPLKMYDPETEKITMGEVFSIGGFFFKINIMFNLREPNEDEII